MFGWSVLTKRLETATGLGKFFEDLYTMVDVYTDGVVQVRTWYKDVLARNGYTNPYFPQGATSNAEVLTLDAFFCDRTRHY